MLLGVNIDHIATLRNARGGAEPDLIECAMICEKVKWISRKPVIRKYLAGPSNRGLPPTRPQSACPT